MKETLCAHRFYMSVRIGHWNLCCIYLKHLWVFFRPCAYSVMLSVPQCLDYNSLMRDNPKRLTDRIIHNSEQNFTYRSGEIIQSRFFRDHLQLRSPALHARPDLDGTAATEQANVWLDMCDWDSRGRRNRPEDDEAQASNMRGKKYPPIVTRTTPTDNILEYRYCVSQVGRENKIPVPRNAPTHGK